VVGESVFLSYSASICSDGPLTALELGHPLHLNKPFLTLLCFFVVANPFSLVFNPLDDSEPEFGAVFQIYKNRQYDRERNEPALEQAVQEKLNTGDAEPAARQLIHYLAKKMTSRFTQIYQHDPWIPSPYVYRAIMQDTVIAAESARKPKLGTMATFDWRDSNFIVAPSGPLLNVIRIYEIRPIFDGKNLSKSLHIVGFYDLKAPIQKVRAAASYFSPSATPLIAIQTSANELAIIRFRHFRHKVRSGGENKEARLIERLQFRAPLIDFAWDERHSTVRDTRSICILTEDGAIFNWQGKDKLRILRGPEYAADLCGGDNFGHTIFFGGQPSTLLILTNDSLEKIDFSTSASTQETVLTFWGELLLHELNQQRAADREGPEEKEATLKKPYKPIMRRPKVDYDKKGQGTIDKDIIDEEAEFRSTAQIMMEAEKDDITSDARHRGPVQQQFNLEWERTKEAGPAFRLMPGEAVRSAVQHPTHPFRCAILTTMRVMLLDERKPTQPLAQWRHHLVKSRQRTPSHISPFFLECPQTLQFIIPQAKFSEVPSLSGKFFILVSSAANAELFSFDDGPQDISTESQLEDRNPHPSDFPLLPTATQQKSALDNDILSLMEAIVKDITKPNQPPAVTKMTSNALKFSMPLPSAPRMLGPPQKLFVESHPIFEEFDRLRTEHIQRQLIPHASILGISGIVGTWKFIKGVNGNEKPILGLLAIRTDCRGNLHVQLNPFCVKEVDLDAITALDPRDTSSSESEEGNSESSSGSPSDSDETSEAESSSTRSSRSSSSSSSPSSNQRKQPAKRKRAGQAHALGGTFIDSDASSSDEEPSDDQQTSGSSSDSEYEAEQARRYDQYALASRTILDGERELSAPRLAPLMILREPLVANPSELQPHDVFNVGPIAEAMFGTTEISVPDPIVYEPAIEQKRENIVQECQGDFMRLRTFILGLNHQEKVQMRNIRKRINPYTGRVENPSNNSNGAIESSQGNTQSIQLEDGEEASGTVAHTQQSKHTWRTLNEERGALTAPQYAFLTEKLEEVLTSMPHDLAPTPIDLAVLYDVIPCDLKCVERILCRVRYELFFGMEQCFPRSTAEIYRTLVEKNLIHPFYFPVSILRSMLAFYVAQGVMDYIPMRSISKTLYGIEDEIEPARFAVSGEDMNLYRLTTSDELDTFISNRTGTEDVDMAYIIGQTKRPESRPTPALGVLPPIESWRSPRFAYPPEEPTLDQATQSMSMMLSTQPTTLERVPTASQLTALRVAQSSAHMDAATQQSQILELLQTQQPEEEPEVNVLEEGNIATEKLNAPATEAQLMGQLLRKWELWHEDPAFHQKVRSTLFSPPPKIELPTVTQAPPSTQSLLLPSQSISMDL
jgi:hypothetical protein